MRRFTLPLVFLALAISGGACLAQPEVWVVAGQDPTHDAFVKYLRGELATQPIAATLKVIPVAQIKTGELPLDRDATRLVIAVGATASREVRVWDPAVPILHVLVPRHVYRDVVRAKSRDSAIVLDQPIGRQLNLLRAALPRASRISVVAGPSSTATLSELRKETESRGFRLVVRDIEKTDQLLAALGQVLPDSDVFFSLADPVVFNNHTAHHVLLTTYRHGVPVLGLSRSYVEAGALLAVHSTPEHVARQLAEILSRLSWSAAPVLPSAQAPRYFTVSVNRRVAAALNLSIPSESQLTQKLAADR